MMPLYSYKVAHAECPQCGSKEAKVTVFHLGATFEATCAQCDVGKFGSTVSPSEKESLAMLDKVHDNFVSVMSKPITDEDCYGGCEDCSCEN